MEKRDLNVSFYKAGGTQATRINLPIPWIKKLGITQDKKKVEVIFDEENQQIIIRKK